MGFGRAPEKGDAMSSSKTIRSLERGLNVLQAMQEHPISSLHDIYRQTRISKPSLLRIPRTLEESGVVSRRLADGRYRISTNVSHLTRKRDHYDHVAEAAAPVLDRLCQKVAWPSDLMVPAGDHMEIRESSRVRTPFAIYFMQDRIGTPVNRILSAVGTAYLAHCPENEREKILALLRRSDELENRLARDSRRVDRILAETRARGYGTRDATFDGGAYGRQSPDGLAGVAVPLAGRGRVHGVINIVWAKSAKGIDDMIRDHLDHLQAAASEIVASLLSQKRRM
jgi:IclR family mhp operon transcriptional activator